MLSSQSSSQHIPTEGTPSAVQPKPTPAPAPARGTVQLFVARSCFLVSGYIISVILARGLGPAEYGVYGVLMSVLVWIELLGSAGIPRATTKLLPKLSGQAAAVAQAARILLLLVFLGLFCLAWLFAPMLVSLLGLSAKQGLFCLAMFDLPFWGLYLAYQGVLSGQHRFGLLGLSMVVYSLTKLAGTVALLVLGLSVAGALSVNVLATVGVLIYLMSKMPPTGPWPSSRLMVVMLRTALPIGVYLATVQMLLNLAHWSLQSLWSGPQETIGHYMAALNLAKIVAIAPFSLSGVLFASLSSALARQDEALAHRYLQSAGRFAFVVLMPVCTLLALHAEAVLTFLYSPRYAAGGVYLGLQLVAFGSYAFLDMYAMALMATGKPWQVVWRLLLLVPVALLANLLLIPYAGAVGAALALALASGSGTMLIVLLTYRRFGALIPRASVVRIPVATVLTALLGSYIPVRGPWLILKGIVLMGGYAMLLGVLREIRWEDLRAVAFWRRSLAPQVR